MANPEPRTRDDSAEQVDTLVPDVQSADKLRVRVDQDQCTGDGLCVQYAPDVFEFDVDGLAYVKGDDGELRTAPGAAIDVPQGLHIAVIDAADECPGDCIYVHAAD